MRTIPLKISILQFKWIEQLKLEAQSSFYVVNKIKLDNQRSITVKQNQRKVGEHFWEIKKLFYMLDLLYLVCLIWTFKLKGQRIQCHKFILPLISLYWNCLFNRWLLHQITPDGSLRICSKDVIRGFHTVYTTWSTVEKYLMQVYSVISVIICIVNEEYERRSLFYFYWDEHIVTYTLTLKGLPSE